MLSPEPSTIALLKYKDVFLKNCTLCHWSESELLFYQMLIRNVILPASVMDFCFIYDNVIPESLAAKSGHLAAVISNYSFCLLEKGKSKNCSSEHMNTTSYLKSDVWDDVRCCLNCTKRGKNASLAIV